ncbi:hypothetical protein FOA52_015983 [Chlamydomonas sp. UWO 241]|nr:hypothetical protein FOA52_015983 [Chlamydomonas sp. UWO 241]
MDFSALEEADGVRMTWNVWPTSKVEATKCVIPFTAIYTPNKRLPNMPVLPYEPVQCKHCSGILNPYARVDFGSKVWSCPLCMNRNHFPPHYQGISEASMPAELYSTYCTIEYTMTRTVQPHPPVYLFMIDTCASEDELAACKTAVMQGRTNESDPDTDRSKGSKADGARSAKSVFPDAYARPGGPVSGVADDVPTLDPVFLTQWLAKAITTLPEYVYVGLITFGRHVHVYELGFADCSKVFVFRGSKEYTNQAIVDQLGVKAAGPAPRPQPGQPAPHPNAGPPKRRFLMPLGEAEFALTTALEELCKDAYPVAASHRPSRCTGTALQVATALLGSSLPIGNCSARILALIGGPCTEGQGKVVGPELSEVLRSHKDLLKDAAPHFRGAAKFYASIASELVTHGHTLDYFTCSLDQVGLAEMKDCVQYTGGMVVQSDTFHNPVFRESLKRMFAKDGEDGFLGVSSNATVEIIPSKDIKVSGCLGPVARVDKKSAHIADNEVGVGGTTVWKLCGLDTETSLAVVLEVTASSKDQSEAAQQAALTGAAGPQLFLQFITKYLHFSGELRCRVTTLTRRWVDGATNAAELVTGFDQEAAAVLMARLASWKMEVEEDFDATRWLDRALIRLAARFGDYRKDDPTSFNLRPELSFYPQFMFNLRRSQFVQVFGNSPDETACFRLVLYRVSVPDAMVMIQPQLTAYSFNGPPEPVLLDVQSILPDRILMLDAYFYIVIFHGQTVATWRKAGYHLQPEHEAFAALLAAPQLETKELIGRRFPVPRLVDCDYQGSQARFLLVKLNPSSTHTSTAPTSAEVINTDDVSLATFTEHLKRLSVAS